MTCSDQFFKEHQLHQYIIINSRNIVLEVNIVLLPRIARRINACSDRNGIPRTLELVDDSHPTYKVGDLFTCTS